MQLFHFTHQLGLEGILRERRILASTAALPPDGAQTKKYGVHLTSDAGSDGHGLPDGREINDGQGRILGYKVNDGGRSHCLNHRMFRLRVIVPESDQKLMKFLNLPSMSLTFAFASDVTAHIPVPMDDKTSHNLELSKISKLLKNCPELRKSETWWIYLGDLPVDYVTHVAYLDGESYNEGTLEEFLAVRKIDSDNSQKQ